MLGTNRTLQRLGQTPPEVPALAVGVRRMKPSALAFTFSRAKEGILRAKLAVLITKDFCRAASPLAAALSVATGISAATRRHGCFANMRSGSEQSRSWDVGQRLRGDAEDRVDELTLTDRIALSDPANLPFSDCMHRLVTFYRPARALRRSEAEARRDPLLDESMVLFDELFK